MNVYLCASSREHNCFKVLDDLKSPEDSFLTLKDKDIKYCVACNTCKLRLERYCFLNDDMFTIYNKFIESDKIVIATPIYFDQISGLFKNVLDRLRPFNKHNSLKGKHIYLITVGALSEEENESVANDIEKYFHSFADIFECDFTFLYNLSSGEEYDDITKSYTPDQYENILNTMKEKIGE